MNSASQTPVVERQYVRALVVKCSVISGIGIFLTAVVLFFTIYNPAGNSYGENYSLLSELRRTILVKSILLYGFSSLLIILGVWAITLLYSHRVAGPLYRLGVIVREISAGKLGSRATLRRHDAIQPLADELNSLTEFYRRIMMNTDEHIGELKNEIDDFSLRDGKHGSEADESKRVIRLVACARALREQFEKVRL